MHEPSIVRQRVANKFHGATPPTAKTRLRRFLGMTGYYRRFFKTYSTIAAPLNKYIKGDQAEMFELNEEALPSHTTLEKAITSAPVLLCPGRLERMSLRLMLPHLNSGHNSCKSKKTKLISRSGSVVAPVRQHTGNIARPKENPSQLFGVSSCVDRTWRERSSSSVATIRPCDGCST
jgi:hypothetical protein